MKSWEWEREIREEVTEEVTEAVTKAVTEAVTKAVKKEDSVIIEAERERADKAEKDNSRLEAELAKYKAKFGEIA